MSEDFIIRMYCNACKRWTKHNILFHHRFDNPVVDIHFYIDVFVWYCMGCEDVTYQTSFSRSDELNVDGQLIYHPFYFPERQNNKIIVKRFVKLPSNLTSLYLEIIQAFNNSCLILASMGLRSLLEGICKDKGINEYNLEKMIDKMTFISDSIKTNLHGIRFLGNDAAHELNSLSRDETLIAIEIMEDVMNYVYELDYKSSRIFQIINEKHQTKDLKVVLDEISPEDMKTINKASSG